MSASSFGSARASYGQSMLRDVMRALNIADFSQNTPHHFGTFAEHVDAVIESPYLEEVDGKHGGLLTFAAVFHDIGKADVKDVHRRTGYDTFYGHEKRSTVLWNELADRALPGMSTEDKQYVSDLILAHHNSLHLAQSSDVKKFLAVIDGRPESFAADLIRLEMADVLAQSDYHRIEKLTEIQAFAEKLASVMPEGEGRNELRSVQSELADTIAVEEPLIQKQQLLDFTSNAPHWELAQPSAKTNPVMTSTFQTMNTRTSRRIRTAAILSSRSAERTPPKRYGPSTRPITSLSTRVNGAI